MNRLCGSVLTLLLVIATAAQAVAPPDGPLTLGSFPILNIREVEEPCGPPTTLASCTTPEVRPGVVIQRVVVNLPFTETVFVPHTTKELRPYFRTVYRQVPCTQHVFVPTISRVPKLCMVYHPREELRPRTVYVPTIHQEARLRSIYRTVPRQEVCTHDVYVPVVTREKKVRLVYVQEPVKITRTVPSIHMTNVPQPDPATGKMILVSKPVCEYRQVTQTEMKVSLCPREVEEKVTNYRLERRTEMRTVHDHVLTCQMVNENVTTYHLETRLTPEKVYDLRPTLIEEKVTHYRLECRTELRTVKEYIPDWREENVTTYHLETRCGVRPVEQTIVCKGEIVVPVTRTQPIPWPQTRKRWVAEPLAAPSYAAPGCVTGSGGGITASCGPMTHAPLGSR